MSKRACIGIDIGGTKTLAALFDDQFEVLEEIKSKTQVSKGEKPFTEMLTENVTRLVEKAKKKGRTLVSAGVGCSGWVDAEKGSLKDSPHIPFLKGYALHSRISKLTGTNVTLLNDVQAGLYGEYHLGSAAGCRHAIGIFIGTGIGGALLLNGKLFVGARGRAGDIGHYLMHAFGALAGTDRQGVLDDLASRVAIAGDALTLAAKQQAPHLLEAAGTDIARIHSQDLANAIKKGDKSIEELMRSRMHILGVALSNFVDLLNPEVIVLGGGLTEAMPQLVRHEVEKAIQKHATPASFEGLKVVVAKLKGHAVTTGAAKFAQDMFLASQPLTKPAANS